MLPLGSGSELPSPDQHRHHFGICYKCTLFMGATPHLLNQKLFRHALQVLLMLAEVGNYSLEAASITSQLTLEKGRHFFLALILWVLIFLILT